MMKNEMSHDKVIMSSIETPQTVHSVGKTRRPFNLWETFLIDGGICSIYQSSQNFMVITNMMSENLNGKEKKY